MNAFPVPIASVIVIVITVLPSSFPSAALAREQPAAVHRNASRRAFIAGTNCTAICDTHCDQRRNHRESPLPLTLPYFQSFSTEHLDRKPFCNMR